jgi:hypothetical protein
MVGSKRIELFEFMSCRSFGGQSVPLVMEPMEGDMKKQTRLKKSLPKEKQKGSRLKRGHV